MLCLLVPVHLLWRALLLVLLLLVLLLLLLVLLLLPLRSCPCLAPAPAGLVHCTGCVQRRQLVLQVLACGSKACCDVGGHVAAVPHNHLAGIVEEPSCQGRCSWLHVGVDSTQPAEHVAGSHTSVCYTLYGS